MRRRLKTLLAAAIPPEELNAIYNSYDIIGDIAVIRLNENSKKYGQIIAETIMKVHKNVKTVLAQVSPIHGDFRLRKLEYIAGENKTKTVHRESECIFAVDLASCYFSPRLFYERMRIAKLVRDGETVVNMFAGVGCFSIVIAKHSNAAKIYSIDINPTAVQFMKENIRLNRVNGKVVPIEGDAKDVIRQKLSNIADRVLMPLPEKALEYLPYAISALKSGVGWIHFYAFEHANRNENPVEKTIVKVADKLQKLHASFEIPFGRVVRTIGPNWYQTVVDILCKGLAH